MTSSHRCLATLALVLFVMAPRCEAQCSSALAGGNIWALSQAYVGSTCGTTEVVNAFKFTGDGCFGNNEIQTLSQCYGFPNVNSGSTVTWTVGAGAPWDAQWDTVSARIEASPTPNWVRCAGNTVLRSWVSTGTNPHGQFKWGCVDVSAGNNPTCYDNYSNCTTLTTANIS